MFEKEAEKYLKKDGTKAEQILDMLNEISPLKITLKQLPFILAMIQQAYKDGAEFGYNKANEWHYVKDGIMPAENQWVLVYDGSYTVCNYHSNAPINWLDNYENEVYEGTIIAWKEITLPKEIKENY